MSNGQFQKWCKLIEQAEKDHSLPSSTLKVFSNSQMSEDQKFKSLREIYDDLNTNINEGRLAIFAVYVKTLYGQDTISHETCDKIMTLIRQAFIKLNLYMQ